MTQKFEERYVKEPPTPVYKASSKEPPARVEKARLFLRSEDRCISFWEECECGDIQGRITLGPEEIVPQHSTMIDHDLL